MRGRPWTLGEKFALLKYPTDGVEKLSKELGRSKCSVKTMAQYLNVTGDYNLPDAKEDCTTIQFCKDCLLDKNTCGMDVHDCLKEAELYNKFHTVKDARQPEVKHKIVWKKSKKEGRYKPVERPSKLPFSFSKNQMQLPLK